MIRQELSILIPAYNSVCARLVRELHAESLKAGLTDFEIIVAEDGTTNRKTLGCNASVARKLDRVRHLVFPENHGRAAVRNLLAREARFDWLLFVDSHMMLPAACSERTHSFLKPYLLTEGPLLYGGYVVEADAACWKGNLRYQYEVASANINEQDARHGRLSDDYRHFHTANFLIAREVMLAHPFDETLHRYGYEDDLFGRELAAAGIPLIRIDNPLAFSSFEPNTAFMAKTEEALCSLYSLRGRMAGFSRLLCWVRLVEVFRLSAPFLYIYNRCNKKWRANLCGNSPSLLLFQLYKLGFYLSLKGA